MGEGETEGWWTSKRRVKYSALVRESVVWKQLLYGNMKGKYNKIRIYCKNRNIIIIYRLKVF